MDKKHNFCSVWFYDKAPIVKFDSNGHHELLGTTKNAAKAIFKAIIASSKDGSISTSWNDMLKIHHSPTKYEMVWLKGNPPKFFDKLNNEFKRLAELRVFL